MNAGLAGLDDRFAVPPLMHEAGLNDTILSVGAAGAGLPFHNHAAAWQSVVHGQKLFLLLPPLNSEHWPSVVSDDPKGTGCTRHTAHGTRHRLHTTHML